MAVKIIGIAIVAFIVFLLVKQLPEWQQSIINAAAFAILIYTSAWLAIYYWA